MNENRTTKKVFNVEPIGTRGKGRPNLRWVDGLDKDLLVSGLGIRELLAGRSWHGKGFLRRPRPNLGCRILTRRGQLSSGRFIQEVQPLTLIAQFTRSIFDILIHPQWSCPVSPCSNYKIICQVIYSQFGLAIHQNDHQARRRFVEWAQNEIAVVPDFHKRILFSDEAHFWLNGYVNKQNCRIWSEANPQVYVETPLHPEKLTVWCALWAGGILLQKR
ncbi:hypothetical protein TNCV_4589981 [Trichonephila clavipes]|nr:hypothetical protein TNCV_4589981 [Trichonephila clavipes]